MFHDSTQRNKEIVKYTWRDTAQILVGTGFGVLAARQLRQEWKSYKRIADELEDVTNRYRNLRWAQHSWDWKPLQDMCGDTRVYNDQELIKKAAAQRHMCERNRYAAFKQFGARAVLLAGLLGFGEYLMCSHLIWSSSRV